MQKTHRLRQYLLAALTLGSCLLLPGCGTYIAKTAYEDRMAELCAIDGGVQILKQVELPASAFVGTNTFKGRLLQPGKLIAGRYAYKEEVRDVLRDGPHLLTLAVYLETVTDVKTGELLGKSVSYFRQGGDSFALNNTVNSCPAPGVRSLLDVFKRGAE